MGKLSYSLTDAAGLLNMSENELLQCGFVGKIRIGAWVENIFAIPDEIYFKAQFFNDRDSLQRITFQGGAFFYKNCWVVFKNYDLPQSSFEPSKKIDFDSFYWLKQGRNLGPSMSNVHWTGGQYLKSRKAIAMSDLSVGADELDWYMLSKRMAQPKIPTKNNEKLLESIRCLVSERLRNGKAEKEVALEVDEKYEISQQELGKLFYPPGSYQAPSTYQSKAKRLLGKKE